ncbi:MAG: DUF459 domain-containing protein [Acidimicrobiales bacterium]
MTKRRIPPELSEPRRGRVTGGRAPRGLPAEPAAPRDRGAERVAAPPRAAGQKDKRQIGGDRSQTTAEPVRGGRRIRTRFGQMAPRVDRELFRQPSGRRSSAGRALAVGLVCFGLWTLFDANQLYHNALTSPFGTRRSVAIAILRPIAAITDAVGLSGPVNAADSALGRNGASTNPTLPPPPPPPFSGARAPNDAESSGVAPRPHSRPGQGTALIIGAKAPVWPPPLRQPSRAHPLVMLDIGDSIGEDLGYGLGDVFSNDPFVHLIQKGRIDTGLARPDIYNWPAVLDADLRLFHPGAVVIMLGANDDQALEQAGERAVPVGTEKWNQLYRQRIGLLMDEATASGAHVIWVGLPPLQAPSVNSAFAIRVNQMAEELAASRSGVTYVASWKLLAGPKGGFVQYKRVDGSVQQIRYGDGVHLAPAGWDLLASSLLGPMSHAWKMNLHAAPLLRLG